MADPGVDGEIEKADQVLHPDFDDRWEEEWEEEKTLTDPSRYWFASTGCPLIAATVGPMANAFNICALVEEWRERNPPDRAEGYGQLVPDPSYIIAVNAVSLACAVIANAALLMNMFDRVSFAIAQPIIIVGFGVASFLLFAIIGVAASGVMRLHDLPPGWVQYHTQGFYYANFAAAYYFVLSVLMSITVWGALAGKYDKKFQITASQKTLMFQTITVMVYLLVGSAIFNVVEGWRFNDAMYWADFTLLTIGLGDRYVPKTHAGRSLMIIYAFGGILAVGLVISSIRSMILEKGARKFHVRSTERRRQRVDKVSDALQSWPLFIHWLIPKSKSKPKRHPENMTERERRELEFHAMRQLQEKVKKENQYKSLAVSVFNAAMLWFLGALVFYKVEYQPLTYFESIYFCFVSLVTIGYGDIQPKTNCGRAFYVFWTLLAVPTLTVLISDMSDTVVKGVVDLTNWVGSFTVTPGDQRFFQNFRQNINWVTAGWLFKSHQAPAAKEYRESRWKGKSGEGDAPLYDVLDERLTDSEKTEMDEYCKTSSETLEDRDIHFYHYLLMKEVRNVVADKDCTPPKKYSYDEWAYFLKILGHDEADPSYHTQKYNSLAHGKRDDDPAPQVARILDHDGNPRHWGWLSLRSPLIGLQNEADWILSRLLSKLQADLHFQGKPGRGIGDLAPPISLSRYRGFATAEEAHGYRGVTKGAEFKKEESTFD